MKQLCRITLLCLAIMATLHNTSEGKKGSSSSSSKGSSSSSSKGSSSSSSKGSSSSSSKGSSSSSSKGSSSSGGQHLAGGQPGRFQDRYPSTVGAYPNRNPNNKILSPRYRGGFGGAGHGIGGSSFSHSVQIMGYSPSTKSKGFAKKAMVAAAVGGVAGMAVGYGVGRFQKHHSSFYSPQEERYYNHYMYRRYGTKSTDENDYSRDYVFKPPPQAESYENYMSTCMNRTDLLQEQETKVRNFEKEMSRCPGRETGNLDRPDSAQKDKSVSRSPEPATNTLQRPCSVGCSFNKVHKDRHVSGSPALSNGILEGPEPAGSTIGKVQKYELTSGPPALDTTTPERPGSAGGSISNALRDTSIPTPSPIVANANLDVLVPTEPQESDDDTVSIMEIGYPALVQQMKARKCVQLYLVYSEGFLQKQTAPRGSSSSGPRQVLSTIIVAVSSSLLLHTK